MAFTIGEIFTFANCSINSRNVVEGEQVLKSKQIILCGKIVKVYYLYIIIFKQIIACNTCKR